METGGELNFVLSSAGAGSYVVAVGPCDALARPASRLAAPIEKADDDRRWLSRGLYSSGEGVSLAAR